MTIEKSGLCCLCDDGEREKGEIKTRIYSRLAYCIHATLPRATFRSHQAKVLAKKICIFVRYLLNLNAVIEKHTGDINHNAVFCL
jgi:hypothetical protein